MATISLGNIRTDSVDAGSGTIQTTGAVVGNSVTASSLLASILNVTTSTTGATTTTTLTASGVTNLAALFALATKVTGSLQVTGTSTIAALNCTTVAAGSVICTSVNAGSGLVRTTGYVRGKKVYNNGTELVITQNTPATWAASHYSSRLVTRNTGVPVGPINDNTQPTVAQIVTSLQLTTGDVFELRMDVDNSTSAFDYTFTPPGTIATTSTTTAAGTKTTSVYSFQLTSGTTMRVYRSPEVTLV